MTARDFIEALQALPDELLDVEVDVESRDGLRGSLGCVNVEGGSIPEDSSIADLRRIVIVMGGM